MYGDGSAENVTNLSVWGWLFTIIFTYSGFICLFLGTCGVGLLAVCACLPCARAVVVVAGWFLSSVG